MYFKTNNYFFILTENKNIYSWGHNSDGELGLGDNKDRNIPTIISEFKSISIFAGRYHSIALDGNFLFHKFNQ